MKILEELDKESTCIDNYYVCKSSRDNDNLEEFETEEFLFGGDYRKVIAYREFPEPYHPKE